MTKTDNYCMHSFKPHHDFLTSVGQKTTVGLHDKLLPLYKTKHFSQNIGFNVPQKKKVLQFFFSFVGEPSLTSLLSDLSKISFPLSAEPHTL